MRNKITSVLTAMTDVFSYEIRHLRVTFNVLDMYGVFIIIYIATSLHRKEKSPKSDESRKYLLKRQTNG